MGGGPPGRETGGSPPAGVGVLGELPAGGVPGVPGVYRFRGSDDGRGPSPGRGGTVSDPGPLAVALAAIAPPAIAAPPDQLSSG